MPTEAAAVSPPSLKSVAVVEHHAQRHLSPPEMGHLVAAQDGAVDLTVSFDIDEHGWGPAEGDAPIPRGSSHIYHFNATLQVELRRPEAARDQDPSLPDPIWDLQLKVEIAYVLGADQVAPDPNVVGAFVHRVAQFQIWPFMRETVASTLTRMNLPKLLLPQITARFDDQYLELANEVVHGAFAAGQTEDTAGLVP